MGTKQITRPTYAHLVPLVALNANSILRLITWIVSYVSTITMLCSRSATPIVLLGTTTNPTLCRGMCVKLVLLLVQYAHPPLIARYVGPAITGMLGGYVNPVVWVLNVRYVTSATRSVYNVQQGITVVELAAPS